MQLRPISPLLAISILCCPLLAGGDEAAEQLIRATYKLANDTSTASGLVVRRETESGKSERLLVTAHHVFEQMTGDSFVLIARTRRDDGTFQRREIGVPIRQNGSRLWKKHPDRDLAVLFLPESADVEALPLESFPTEGSLTEVHAGDAVRLAVFPERSEANDAGFPVLRSGSIASFPLTPIKPYPSFLVDTTAWSGDSGGPVMHATLRAPGGGPIVIGIVVGMRNITDMVKESRFVERRTHYPLGISEVLHAAFVRELTAEDHAEK